MRIEQIPGVLTLQQETILSPKVAGALTVHNVHILDSSGSMSGGKYNNAIEGINADIIQSQTVAATTPGLTSTMTIVEFSGTGSAKEHMFMQPINTAGRFSSQNMEHQTALYETMGQTIEKLLSRKQKEDKVLLKIFTDGEENDSRGKYAPIGGASRQKLSPTLANLIKSVQDNDNFTVTFVGTANDTKAMIRNLNVDASNTLIHDNTPESVKMSFNKSLSATTQYFALASRGEDVSKGFYSKSVL